MFKIAILGCENSHADAFIKLIQAGKYPNLEIVGVYSDDESANERMRKNYGVYTAKSFDEFIERVDGVMITARHGDNHLKYALPYIETGMPLFIDKPATASIEDARKLAALLEKYKNPFSGGSSCILTPELKSIKGKISTDECGRVIGGMLRAPVSLDNPYGNFWFYAQHLIQIMQETFGYYPKSVRAFPHDGGVNCVYRYGDFDVYAEFVEGNYLYHLSVSCEKAVLHTDISVTEDIFAYEMDEYYAIVNGGESPFNFSDFFAPVFVMDATIRAIESGDEEQIGTL